MAPRKGMTSDKKPAKKAGAKKKTAPAKKTSAKKAPAKEAPAKKVVPAEKAAPKKSAKKTAPDRSRMSAVELARELGRGPELVRDLMMFGDTEEGVRKFLLDKLVEKDAKEATEKEEKKRLSEAIKRNRGRKLETMAIDLPNGVALEMKELPSGIFMGVVPVTNEQWWAVMGDEPPEKGEEKLPRTWCPRDYPPCDEADALDAYNEVVETGKDLDMSFETYWKIAHDECCARFLETLNESDAAKRAGLAFRLPTAEEWLYACRAGAKGEYCLRDDGVEITDKNLASVSAKERCEVGKRRPNAFGLHDMVGNVCEWTSTDRRCSNYEGGFYNAGVYCGSCYGGSPMELHEKLAWENNFNDPACADSDLGFRLCADRRAD